MSAPLQLLFAHGSSAGHDHPWMLAWGARLEGIGEVHRLTYAYKAAGRPFPPRLPTLVAEHLAAARQLDPARLVLVGKSLGGRVGCVAAAELAAAGTPPRTVVCLGYPLQSRAKTPTLRDGPLRELPVPALLIQGERDPLAPLDTLRQVLSECPQDHVLHVVPDGDHSLRSRVRALRASGRSQEQLDHDALVAMHHHLAAPLPVDDARS